MFDTLKNRGVKTVVRKLNAVMIICSVSFLIRSVFWLWEPVSHVYSPKGTYPLVHYTFTGLIPAVLLFLVVAPGSKKKKQGGFEEQSDAHNNGSGSGSGSDSGSDSTQRHPPPPPPPPPSALPPTEPEPNFWEFSEKHFPEPDRGWYPKIEPDADDLDMTSVFVVQCVCVCVCQSQLAHCGVYIMAIG